MKKIIASFLVSLFAGCLSRPEYLESKYFWHRKIDVVENARNVCISISGLCRHSALGAGRSEETIDGDVLVIEFPLHLGAPGTIQETIHVPSNINKVKAAGDIIWERRHN